MKRIVFVLLFVFSLSLGLVAQETLPTGTAVPVTLTSSLGVGSHPDQLVTGKIMQRIPTERGLAIPAGAKVIGRVIETRRDSEGGAGSTVSLRKFGMRRSPRRVPMKAQARTVGRRYRSEMMSSTGAVARSWLGRPWWGNLQTTECSSDSLLRLDLNVAMP